MKKLIILLLILISEWSKAQTWEEFSRQKATQKKYLLQQLAALKLYAGLLKEGYTTVNKGLTTIKALTNGELNLHAAFFYSLKAVNPIISKNRKVSEILTLQSFIAKEFATNLKLKMTESEVAYFKNVRAKIFQECSTDIEELFLVISSGKLEMKDDERIRRIDHLYDRMKDKYRFTNFFISKVKQLNFQKLQEEKSNQTSKRIYQLNN